VISEKMDILKLINRPESLFLQDLNTYQKELDALVQDSTFLILGAAGSIGQAVTKELFKRQARVLHVVDISENNLAELVRDLRSSMGYSSGDFQTFAIDVGSEIFDSFFNHHGPYDYVLNLTALKHVRSEKDPYTLMRMIEVNILNTLKSIRLADSTKLKKYFCVSTDKAAAPVNMMGASKRIMEKFLFSQADSIGISTARFANVAFSDGSLLHSFSQRIHKMQPLVAPDDIMRYFVTPEESGLLCLFSCLLGANRDVFFPKLESSLNLTSFVDIAKRYLQHLGYEPLICSNEQEARQLTKEIKRTKKWPCLWTQSDTSGEKEAEEFFMAHEELDTTTFENIGIIKNKKELNADELSLFLEQLQQLKKSIKWSRNDLVTLFKSILPEFHHKETGKFLDGKM